MVLSNENTFGWTVTRQNPEHSQWNTTDPKRKVNCFNFIVTTSVSFQVVSLMLTLAALEAITKWSFCSIDEWCLYCPSQGGAAFEIFRCLVCCHNSLRALDISWRVLLSLGPHSFGRHAYCIVLCCMKQWKWALGSTNLLKDKMSRYCKMDIEIVALK